MIWDIRPLDGLGPLKLGMKLPQVGELLDKLFPVKARHNGYSGSVREYRGLQQPICIYRNEILQGIDTNISVPNVFFQDKNIYEILPRSTLLLLQTRNKGAKISYGDVLFYDISINTTGFYDEKVGDFTTIDRDRTLGVFTADAFEVVVGEFVDIVLS